MVAAPAGRPSIVLDNVSLRFRRHHRSPQIRDAVLTALRGRRRPPAPGAERWLYSGLNLRVSHGERLGIVGHNGAGKSTLLKMIGGIYPPTRGTIRVSGRISPIIDLGAGFNLELSGPDNVLLNGAFLGFSRAEMREKTARIIAFAGLEQAGDRPIKYYSSGMLLRLAFAIATDVDPEILLIDEVLAAGDGEFAVRASERLRELLDTSHIAIVVSHSLALIEQLCSRVIWLNEGAILRDGHPQEVCAEYQQSFEKHPG